MGNIEGAPAPLFRCPEPTSPGARGPRHFLLTRQSLRSGDRGAESVAGRTAHIQLEALRLGSQGLTWRARVGVFVQKARPFSSQGHAES